MTAIDVLSKDPIMRRLVDTFQPVSIGNSPLYEALIGSVISQQLSESASATIYKRLKAISPITPEALSAIDVETYRSCGISKQKAGYLKSISDAALNGELDNIVDKPADEIIDALTKFKGVGIWTAQMVLIFACGHQDIWASKDVGLLRSARKLYNIQTVEEFIELGERFRPYRSHAAWYLWCVVDTKPK
jgi:DNA-3-methyladenine glycosylase II